MVWADVSKRCGLKSVGWCPTVKFAARGFNREIIRKLLVPSLQAQRDMRSCLNPGKTTQDDVPGIRPLLLVMVQEECVVLGVNVYMWGWAMSHQNSEAPPRPPMVTSVIPSPFRSMTPWMDWPKNFTFSPSPPAGMRWRDTTEPIRAH